MAWFYLFIAGILEIVWVVGIKYCNEFRITIPLILVFIAMVSSIIFLGLAAKTIPMSIAYSVWSGIGIVGVFAYGVVILQESISISSIIFIAMILVGIIGLKLGIK